MKLKGTKMPKVPKKKMSFDKRLKRLVEAYNIQQHPVTDISQIVDLGTDLSHEDMSMVFVLCMGTVDKIAGDFTKYKTANVLTDRHITKAIQSFETVGYEFVVMLLSTLVRKGVAIKDSTIISHDYREIMAQTRR